MLQVDYAKANISADLLGDLQRAVDRKIDYDRERMEHYLDDD